MSGTWPVGSLGAVVLSAPHHDHGVGLAEQGAGSAQLPQLDQLDHHLRGRSDGREDWRVGGLEGGRTGRLEDWKTLRL